MVAGSRPFIPAPNCASVEMIHTLGGQVVENVYHVKKGAPYSGADIIALRTIFNSWDSATYATSRSNGSILTRIRTKALDSNVAPIEDYSLPAGRAGGVAGQMMPNNSTYALKLSTGLSGRSARGRVYIPGLTSAIFNNANNQILATYLASLVTCYNTLLTNLTAGGHTLVVLSYRHDKAWRAEAWPYPVTSFVGVDLNADSQRRRLPGRGRT